MRIFKYIFILVLCALVFDTAKADIGMRALGDSLTAWTGFSPVWSANVRVKSLRVSGNEIVIKTNRTLKDVRWTPQKIAEVKRYISHLVLGHEKGKVSIQVVNSDLDSFVTNCGKGKMTTSDKSDLTDRNIVLYPSHGLYYNRDRDEWIWQRATLWTTVEDLFSHEYARRVTQMLENAGATVYSPRAGLDQQQPGVSGMPQWTEAARYWLVSQGADTTIWDLYDGNEYKDDMKCRAMWVNSLDTPIDLCLALHTDGQDSGNDSTIIGTLVIYTSFDDEGQEQLRDGQDREKVNRNLADWIQTQVTQDLQTVAPNWTRRQLFESNYCESRVPVVPSIILELLSHKNMADMQYGLDPAFRFTAARAIYKGILRYLNGSNAIVQPLPVKQLGIQISNGQAPVTNAVLQWQANLDTLEPTATPTYYMVYIQENDGEWNVQQVEDATQLQVDLRHGVRYNYYVVAGNNGGLSMPSPVISAYMSEQDDAPMVLIVDGFDEVYGPEWFADSTYAGIVPGSYACEDYFSCAYIGQQWDYDRSHPWVNDDNCGFGACYRDHAGEITIGNTHDWSAQHGRVLRRMRISYVSCTAGMMETMRSKDAPEFNFALIDFICGRNKHPLNEAAQNMLEIYLNNAGKLLLSTDHFSAINQTWAKQYLHTSYHAARATRSGRVSSPRHRLYQLMLEPNAQQIFTCHPEGLKPEKDAVKMATYEDMRCTAAVGYLSPGNNDQSPLVKTLVYGFPLEAVMDFDKIYKHAIEWLLEK